MWKLFDVDTRFFTIWNYPMSYIEFVGTILYLWSVWLISKRKMLTWPVGILSVLLYLLLFYQIRLYSDALEQIYYLGASVYGWIHWSKARLDKRTLIDVAYSQRKPAIRAVLLTVFLSIVLGAAMSYAHVWGPALFPEPASYPYIDATTTVMSFVAMWLLARKKIESWIYWIIVDVIGIWLYFVKDVKFVSLLYVFLLILAVRGLSDWNRARRNLLLGDQIQNRSEPVVISS